MRARATAFAMAALLMSGSANAAPASAIVPAPGVHPHEIVVGSVLDLSGPLAAEGVGIRHGLTLAFDEINAKGGVNGRKIRLDARDSAYDPDRARKAARALLGEGIFAMIGSNGTPPVSATMKMVLDEGILHLFAFLPSPAGYEKPERLAFAMDLPVAAQIQIGVKTLLDERGPLHVGVLYSDDEFGRAAIDGAKRELARRGLKLAGDARYNSAVDDLAPQLKTLRNAGVELLVLGAVPQETFRAVAEAHRMGWYPVMLCTSACYVPEAATLGGRAIAGLYSVAATPILYPDMRNVKLRDWVRRYEKRFQTVASPRAFRAYLDARLFAAALRRAGPHPTPLHFARVLEAMPPWTDPDYGGVAVDYTATDHTGLHDGYLAEIMNGRWQLRGGPFAVPAP